MSDRANTAERLAAMEVHLEQLVKAAAEAVAANGQTAREVSAKFDRLEEKLVARMDAIEEAHRADVAELQALKNKGAGVMIGVGLAGTAIGATLASGLQSLIEVLK